MPTLTIHDRTATGRPVGSFPLQVPDRLTVRELIVLRVRDEVARHNLTTTEPFQGLVTPIADETALNGGPRIRDRRVDWRAQADVALDAFGRNGFFVLVDGHQATSLDEEVALSTAPDVAFIRLVPLIGG